MSEEKILDNEILDDEELDGVAGGTFKETVGDRAKLNQLGLYNFDESKGFAGSIKEGFDKLGRELGLDVKCDSSLSNDTANRYQIDNRKMTRDEFWSIINEGFAANK